LGRFLISKNQVLNFLKNNGFGEESSKYINNYSRLIISLGHERDEIMLHVTFQEDGFQAIV
jgi:hypothetical protein